MMYMYFLIEIHI